MYWILHDMFKGNKLINSSCIYSTQKILELEKLSLIMQTSHVTSLVHGFPSNMYIYKLWLHVHVHMFFRIPMYQFNYNSIVQCNTMRRVSTMRRICTCLSWYDRFDKWSHYLLNLMTVDTQINVCLLWPSLYLVNVLTSLSM